MTRLTRKILYVLSAFTILYIPGNTIAQASCVSHSTVIPYRKTVCFSKNLRQYMCVKKSGRYKWRHVQKLTLRSSLNLCWHVDHYNTKPDRK